MSPRPKLSRQLDEPPSVTGFVPKNGDYHTSDKVILFFEEYESIKLMDYEGLNQIEASERLKVSRPTLTRIYDSARKKVAKAFVENKAISIEGGNVSFIEHWYYCNHCHSSYKQTKQKSEDELACKVCNDVDISLIQDTGNWPVRPMNIGSGNGSFKGSSGNCICPKCDFILPHEPGIPCSTSLCPNCNIRMIREDSEHHKFILKIRK